MDAPVEEHASLPVLAWMAMALLLTAVVVVTALAAGALRRPGSAVVAAPCPERPLLVAQHNVDRLGATLAGAALEAYAGRPAVADSLVGVYMRGLAWVEGDLAGASARQVRALRAREDEFHAALREGGAEAGPLLAAAWGEHSAGLRSLVLRSAPGPEPRP